MEPILRRVGPNWRWVFVRMKIRLVLTMVSCRWKLPNLDHYLAEEDLADESQRCGACVPRPKCDGLRLEAEDPTGSARSPCTFSPKKGWHCSSHKCNVSFWEQFSNDRSDMIIMASRFFGQTCRRVSAEGKSQRQIKREEMMIAGEASDLSDCVHVALAQAYGKEVTSLYLKRTRSSTSRASGPVDKGNIRLSNIITNDAAILMNYRVEGSARWLARAWRGHVMNRVLMMMLKAVGANPEVLEYVKNRFSTAISRDQVWS